MQKQSIVIEPHETIKEFRLYLYERENAKATIDKYLTDVNTFYKFLNHNYEIPNREFWNIKSGCRDIMQFPAQIPCWQHFHSFWNFSESVP